MAIRRLSEFQQGLPSGSQLNAGLSPYEEDGQGSDKSSLVSTIGGTFVSALGMLGNVFDLSGSMVRDTIAGNNPVDQIFSPLSSDNRASGRDVLENYGMRANKETGFVPLEDPGEFARDVAGFGVEMLLDPLGWMTGWASKAPGALARGAAARQGQGFAGKAFSRLGKTVDSIDPGFQFARALRGKFNVYRNPQRSKLLTEQVHPFVREIMQNADTVDNNGIVMNADEVTDAWDITNEATAKTWVNNNPGKTVDDWYGEKYDKFINMKWEDFKKQGLTNDENLLQSPSKRSAAEDSAESYKTLRSDIVTETFSGEIDPKFHMNTLVGRVIDNWRHGLESNDERWQLPESSRDGAWFAMKEAVADFAASLPYTSGKSALTKSSESVDQVRGLRDAFPGGKKVDDILIPLRRMWAIQKSAFGENAVQRDFENIIQMLDDPEIWNLQDPRMTEWIDGLYGEPDVFDRELRGTQYITGDPEHMKSPIESIGGKNPYNTMNYRFSDSDETAGWIHETINSSSKLPGETPEAYLNRIQSGPSHYHVEIPGRELETFKGSDAYDESFKFLQSRVLKLKRESSSASTKFEDLLGKDAGPLFQNITEGLATGARGAITFDPLTDAATIRAFEGADVSTLFHETGHVFRRNLGDISPDLMRKAELAFGVAEGAKWSRDQEEAFAEQWESYLIDGAAPTKDLDAVFGNFKTWLTEVYRSVRNNPEAVSPESRAVFDGLLSEGDNVSRAVAEYHLNKTPVWQDQSASEHGGRDVGKGDVLYQPGKDSSGDTKKEIGDINAAKQGAAGGLISGIRRLFNPTSELKSTEQYQEWTRLQRDAVAGLSSDQLQAISEYRGDSSQINRMLHGGKMKNVFRHEDIESAHNSARAIQSAIMSLPPVTEEASVTRMFQPEGLNALESMKKGEVVESRAFSSAFSSSKSMKGRGIGKDVSARIVVPPGTKVLPIDDTVVKDSKYNPRMDEIVFPIGTQYRFDGTVSGKRQFTVIGQNAKAIDEVDFTKLSAGDSVLGMKRVSEVNDFGGKVEGFRSVDQGDTLFQSPSDSPSIRLQITPESVSGDTIQFSGSSEERVLTVNGKEVGGTSSTPGGSEAHIASRMFPGLGISVDDEVYRIQGIEVDESFRERGLGKLSYLDMFNSGNGKWFYNSQSEPAATRALKALARDGHIELHWRGGEGNVHVARITDSGREYLDAKINGNVAKHGAAGGIISAPSERPRIRRKFTPESVAAILRKLKSPVSADELRETDRLRDISIGEEDFADFGKFIRSSREIVLRKDVANNRALRNYVAGHELGHTVDYTPGKGFKSTVTGTPQNQILSDIPEFVMEFTMRRLMKSGSYKDSMAQREQFADLVNAALTWKRIKEGGAPSAEALILLIGNLLPREKKLLDYVADSLIHESILYQSRKASSASSFSPRPAVFSQPLRDLRRRASSYINSRFQNWISKNDIPRASEAELAKDMDILKQNGSINKDARVVTQLTPVQNLVRRAVAQLGGDLHYYGGTGSNVAAGVVIRNAGNRLWVGADQLDGGLLGVTGHEMMHLIRKADPEAFKTMLTRVLNSVNPDGAKKLADAIDSYGDGTLLKSNPGIAVEEGMAQLMRAAVKDQAVWTRIINDPAVSPYSRRIFEEVSRKLTRGMTNSETSAFNQELGKFLFAQRGASQGGATAMSGMQVTIDSVSDIDFVKNFQKSVDSFAASQPEVNPLTRLSFATDDTARHATVTAMDIAERIGLAVGAAMNYKYLGKTTQYGQSFAGSVVESRESLNRHLSEPVMAVEQVIGSRGLYGVEANAAWSQVRNAIETGNYKKLDEELQGPTAALHHMFNETLGLAKFHGVKASELDDYIDYFRRKAHPIIEAALDSAKDSETRVQMFRGWLNGTEGIDSALTDKNFLHLSVTKSASQGANYLRKTLDGDVDPRMVFETASGHIKVIFPDGKTGSIHSSELASDWELAGPSREDVRAMSREDRAKEFENMLEYNSRTSIDETGVPLKLTIQNHLTNNITGDTLPDRFDVVSQWVSENKLARHLETSGGVFRTHAGVDAKEYASRFSNKLAIAKALPRLLGQLIQSRHIDEQIVGLGQQISGQNLSKLLESEPFRFLDPQKIFENVESMSPRATAMNKADASWIQRAIIPQDLYDDLVKTQNQFNVPDALQPFSKLYNSFTSVFKTAVLTKPARYTRDFMSASVALWTKKLLSPGSFRSGLDVMMSRPSSEMSLNPFIQQFAMRNGMISDPEAFTPDVATKAARAYFASLQGNMAHIANDIDLDVIGANYSADAEAAAMSELLPGTHTKASSLGWDVVKKILSPSNWNPKRWLDVQGVQYFTGDKAKKGFIRRRGTPDFQEIPMVEAGNIIGKNFDQGPRLAGWIEGMRQGLSPEQAFDNMTRLLLDYRPETFGPLERHVLKRVFPFYPFFSRQLASMSHELVTNPTGRLGQIIRVQRHADSQTGENYIPEHVREQMALPVSDSLDGGKTYLTGFGLMHEGVAGTAMSSLTSPQDFARNVVSMSNPLLKGFAEFGLGVSSFQGGPMGGRDIADMDPLLGRIFTQAGLQNELPSQQAAPAFGSRSLEFLLANSPFSAVLSTAKTALDYDRKTGMQRALNLLTGLKFTTVSPEGSRRALREVINADARDVGARAFETFHVSPELIEYVRQNFPERLERILAGKRMIEIWNQEDRVKKRIRRTQEKAGAKS